MFDDSSPDIATLLVRHQAWELDLMSNLNYACACPPKRSSSNQGRLLRTTYDGDAVMQASPYPRTVRSVDCGMQNRHPAVVQGGTVSAAKSRVCCLWLVIASHPHGRVQHSDIASRRRLYDVLRAK